jgi:hypothetical protein
MLEGTNEEHGRSQKVGDGVIPWGLLKCGIQNVSLPADQTAV